MLTYVVAALAVSGVTFDETISLRDGAMMATMSSKVVIEEPIEDVYFEMSIEGSAILAVTISFTDSLEWSHFGATPACVPSTARMQVWRPLLFRSTSVTRDLDLLVARDGFLGNSPMMWALVSEDNQQTRTLQLRWEPILDVWDSGQATTEVPLPALVFG
jgi:hypothetical protein